MAVRCDNIHILLARLEIRCSRKMEVRALRGTFSFLSYYLRRTRTRTEVTASLSPAPHNSVDHKNNSGPLMNGDTTIFVVVG
jgi:hypothetical protein